MNTESKPRITVRHVLFAAADVTGSPVSQLASSLRFEPVKTHRACLCSAAHQLGLTMTGTARALRLHPRTVRRRPDVEAEHADTIEAIKTRAAERAASGQVYFREAPARVSAKAVLVAAARVAGGSVRDIIERGRAQPWETYRLCALAAARHLGVRPVDMAGEIGRRPNTISGRPGRVAEVAEAHGGTVERIKALARELAALPAEHLDVIGRALVAAPGMSEAA